MIRFRKTWCLVLEVHIDFMLREKLGKKEEDNYSYWSTTSRLEWKEARKGTIHSVERSNETLDEKESKLIKEEKTNDENCEVAKRMLENASRNFKVAVEKGDMLGVRLAGECYKVPGTNLHWLPSIELQPERRDQIW